MGNICSSLIPPSDVKTNVSKPVLTKKDELPQGQNNNLVSKSACCCHITKKKKRQPGKIKKPIGNPLKRKKKAVRKKLKKPGKFVKNLLSNSITANQEQDQLDEELTEKDFYRCSAQNLPIIEVVTNKEEKEYSGRKKAKKSKKGKVKKNKIRRRLWCRCKAENCSTAEKLTSSSQSENTEKAKKDNKAGNNKYRYNTNNCLPAEELTVANDHLNDQRSMEKSGEEYRQLYNEEWCACSIGDNVISEE